jgi:diguanylate cyclase (GGDEF)-like protein
MLSKCQLFSETCRELSSFIPAKHVLFLVDACYSGLATRSIASASQNRESVSLISFDLNHFKELNDTHGHLFGDQLLKRVANILGENFKAGNFAGRYGGDEFLIVLPNSRAETAFVLAEEVRKLIEDTEMEISVGEQTVTCKVSVSGGVAAYPTDARDQVDVLRKADEALYRAKRTGRNRICLPTDSQMVTKTSHYTQTQLERLAELAKTLGKSEAFLLREAVDDLLRKYDDSLKAPNIDTR